MGQEAPPPSRPLIESADTVKNNPDKGKKPVASMDLYNNEAKQAMEGLYKLISMNLQIDPSKKQDLWKAVEQQVDIEVGEKKNELNRMAETQTDELMDALANKQVEVVLMLQTMHINLNTAIQDAALSWGTISNKEVDELAANAEMLLPIEVRGLTKQEQAQLGVQKNYTSRLLAETPQLLKDIVTGEALNVALPDIEIPPDDVKSIREALLPESDIDKTVKLLTGQKELEGYQRVLLAPANTLESVAKGFLLMPQTIASMGKMATALSKDGSLAKLGVDSKIVIKVIDQYFTAAEKVAFLAQFIMEGAVTVGVGAIATKLEKFPRLVEILATLSKLHKEKKALRIATTVGEKTVTVATHEVTARTTALGSAKL